MKRCVTGSSSSSSSSNIRSPTNRACGDDSLGWESVLAADEEQPPVAQAFGFGLKPLGSLFAGGANWSAALGFMAALSDFPNPGCILTVVDAIFGGCAGIEEAATPKACRFLPDMGVLLVPSTFNSGEGVGSEGVMIEFRMCIGARPPVKAVGLSLVVFDATVLEEVVLNDEPDTSITAKAATTTTTT